MCCYFSNQCIYHSNTFQAWIHIVHLLFLETLSNTQFNYLSFLYRIHNRCFSPCNNYLYSIPIRYAPREKWYDYYLVPFSMSSLEGYILWYISDHFTMIKWYRTSPELHLTIYLRTEFVRDDPDVQLLLWKSALISWSLACYRDK